MYILLNWSKMVVHVSRRLMILVSLHNNSIIFHLENKSCVLSQNVKTDFKTFLLGGSYFLDVNNSSGNQSVRVFTGASMYNGTCPIAA